MKNLATHHIILYRDEFKADVWKDYCKVLGVPSTSEKIFVPFAKKIVKVI